MSRHGICADALGEFLVGLTFVLLFPLAVVVLFWPAPHEQTQPCPRCGRRKGRYVRETVREGLGRRSWTDLIIAEYACVRCGWAFTMEWTGSSGFD
jgi:hypothetical protein